MGDPIDPTEGFRIPDFPIPIQTSEAAELLEDSRGVLDRRNGPVQKRLKPKGEENKLRELIGEYGARAHVEQHHRGRIKKETNITRRGQKGFGPDLQPGKGPAILDLVYEFENGEMLVLETKQGEADLGRVNKKSIKMGDTAPSASKAIASKALTRAQEQAKRAATRAATEIEKKAIEQFSPQWFQDRIKEIRAKDHRLANKLERAWYDGKVKAQVIFVDDDGQVTQVLDRTDEWNRFKQRAVPDQPTKTPDIARAKPAADKPGAEPKADDKITTRRTVDTPEPRVKGNVAKEPDVLPTKVRALPDQVTDAKILESETKVAKWATAKQQVKARLPGPKVRFVLKIGVGFLLEIAFGLIDSWFEGKAMKEDWQRIAPDVQRLAQAALERANASQELARFRTGGGLEEGYQLYYRIRLRVNTHCNDGPSSNSAYFVSFDPLDVEVVRFSEETGFPETGVNVACGEQVSGTTLYSPLFTAGARIEIGTSHAADGRFEAIVSTVTGRYTASGAWKEYLIAFYAYALVFRDSRAALTWAGMVEDVRFYKVLVGLGLKNPWDLVEGGLSFEHVVDTVPWMSPGLDELPFIEEFLRFAEQWATDEQKARWKKYYDKLASAERGRHCHSNCHLPNERGIGDRLLLDSPPVSGRLPRFRTPTSRYSSGGAP